MKNKEKAKNIYTKFVSFRTSEEQNERLSKFAKAIGRRKSDVYRFLLTQILISYEDEPHAIEIIRRQMH